MTTQPDGAARRAAAALRACEGIPEEVLDSLPEGALAKALSVCSALTADADIAYGMDNDEDVNGGDLVDVVSRCWRDIRFASGAERNGEVRCHG